MADVIPAPTAAADVQASLGKSIDHETNNRLVDDRTAPDAPPADNRSMEDAVTADPWTGKTVDELLALSEAELAGMSEQDLAKAMGLDVSDKREATAPSGDATVHDIDSALGMGTAVEATEADLAPPPAAAAPVAPAAAAPAAVPATATEPEAPAPAADEPYVESRDGKGRIDYSVLKNERSQRQALRAENEALRAQIAAAASATPANPAAAAPAEVVPPTAPAAPRLLSEEQIAKFRETYDDGVVDMWVEQNRTNVATYEDNQRLRAELAAERRTSVEDQVQDHIDGNPLLSKWQGADAATDPKSVALWTQTIATDNMLKGLPQWAEKPWQERIDEAVRITALAQGIAIPAATSQPGPAPNAPAPSLAQRADAALKAASGQVLVPTSHSDLPAGVLPGLTEADAVAGLSPMQLEAKFATMSPDQITAYLAKVA